MSRESTVASIVATVSSYREGAVSPLDAAHVEQWVSVFDAEVQLPILTELDYVLSRTYVTREAFESFFKDAITNAELVGDDPAGFWIQATFFKNQVLGGSQAALLAIFDAALHDICGFSIDDCGTDDGPIVYIDDAVYTQSRSGVD